MNSPEARLSERSHAIVVGGDRMLGAAITAELERAGTPARRSSVPASADEWTALRRGLIADRPAVVFWALPERAGIGRHRRQPATLALRAISAFVELVEACRAAGVLRVVNIVPHCAYPGNGAVPLRESALWDGPPDPGLLAYGSAMRTTIALAEAVRAEHGVFVLSAIVTGLYGPGDDFDAADGQVVGGMVRRFGDAVRAGDDSVHCWGDGAAERELLYVDDAASGIVALADVPESEFDEWGEAIVNVGGTHSGAIVSSTSALAEAVASASGFSGRIEWDAAAPRGRARVMLDDGRLARLLPMRSTRPLAESLALTVDDHRRRSA